ncbi:hypothetical protein AF335_21780 [Streptomyces eurocidicus]|uniref:DUF5667 domain-containing protein n=1 Tax=Streptomyces eurocidicus TaxID=66423 RepID=A0A2N8NRZ2_STREU|nr:DUF5667 domain-containing protein [Streptomyces eurocidicus]MBB5122764.1 hypothetical protein [Streptomyces eurocidicus]MBF6051769.1 hypothetical protein [Streptomyces eurocidicus]PNE31522.1 hypothetical protein AF335_21780 [Streptomyces eurocidicus]
MIANVSAHRRANAFAQALEDQELQGAAATQPGPSVDDTEKGKLLALVGELGGLPAPELDPETRTVQRARLIAAMETQFAEGSAGIPEPRSGRSSKRGAHRALNRLKPRSRWSKGLAAGGLTVGVAAGAFGGVAAASSSALPGDHLYPLKRGMEDFRLGLADDDSDRGGMLLDQAATRLQEARRLLERGRSGPLDHEALGEIRKTLSGMRHDVSEGHRLLHQAYKRDRSLAPIQRLSSFTALHREGWSQLRDKLPVQLSDVGDDVSSLMAAIDHEVGPLRSLLPTAPGKHASEPRPGASSHGTSGRAGHSAPPSQTAAESDGKGPGGHGQRRGAPPGGHEDHEGLIGGTGLLQPPPSPVGPTSSGPTHGGKDGKQSKQPDITIPPLLPDILPGLGIQGDEEK